MQWLTSLVAIVLLDASLTFDNRWPTPAVIWRGSLSIELAIVILGLVAAYRWFGSISRSTVAWLAAIWTVLVIGRYADVTAPALYGRDINLYWDLRFVPDVVSMITHVAPLWLLLVAGTAVAVAFVLLY